MNSRNESDDKLLRVKVKSQGVSLAEAALVSKSFALKFLKKAIVNARIQVIKNPPEAIRKGYDLDANPDYEVWQVWSGTKQALVEVVGPRDVLPFVAVREVYRCILKMNVEVLSLGKKGVRLQATEIPKAKRHADHGRVEGAPCECFGSKYHEDCAKGGCEVCSGKNATQARALRGEAETMIDSVADKELAKIFPEDKAP